MFYFEYFIAQQTPIEVTTYGKIITDNIKQMITISKDLTYKIRVIWDLINQAKWYINHDNK
jgi:hypothetical protein